MWPTALRLQLRWQSIRVFSHHAGRDAKPTIPAPGQSCCASLLHVLFDHRLLLQDEHAACEDVKLMRESEPENRAAIARLQYIADGISQKLRDRLAVCLKCKTTS